MAPNGAYRHISGYRGWMPCGISGRICCIYRAQEVNRAFPETELAAARKRPYGWIDLRPLNIDDRALQKINRAAKVAIMPGYLRQNGFVRLNAQLSAQQASGTRGANASLPGLTHPCNPICATEYSLAQIAFTLFVL